MNTLGTKYQKLFTIKNNCTAYETVIHCTCTVCVIKRVVVDLLFKTVRQIFQEIHTSPLLASGAAPALQRSRSALLATFHAPEADNTLQNYTILNAWQSPA